MVVEVGKIAPIDIDTEMRESYLDYAMSVIVARALPDARDGLKPVQRRILYAMERMGLRPTGPYRKCAGIVGEVLKNYHPHGDAPVYDALVRLAQDFNMRYPLVDGQGNFGSIDGDSPAAMRYTEARLAPLALQMLGDIDKDTVDFAPNFDGNEQEPAVLAALLPNLLVNGATGIAVGMATNLPPHNLTEVCDALIYLIDHSAQLSEIGPDDLMRFIQGPDFPTGGLIIGADGIRSAYATGNGRIVVRSKAHVEEMRGERPRIVVTEIPYQVNKSALIERIAELVREKRLDDIADLRDESDRRGMSIVIELKRGAQPNVVLNQLFKFTQMQASFGVNLLALVDGEPRVLSLKSLLQNYLQHRQVVITRRSKFELARAKERAHILEGLRIALQHVDEVIATIRKSKDAEEAKAHLIKRFKLSGAQAQAILEMQLRRLAALERQRIEEEHKEVIALIAELEDLLANPKKILYLIKGDLQELRRKHGDGRRTIIMAEAAEELREEDLVSPEDVLVSITQRGYIKRVPADTFRAQRRGGRGITGMTTREEDAVQHLFLANTLDSLLFFTDRGRVFQERAYQIPDASRQARGLPLTNLLALEREERITAAIAVSSFEAGRYLFMATQRGKVKRCSLEEFSAVRSSGLIAITLQKGDVLGWVKMTGGGQPIILVTAKGQALRFSEEDVRPMGRQAAGVRGISLRKSDRVAAMDVVDPEGDLLIVTENGFGKRTPFQEYLVRSQKGRRTVYLLQRRGGKGRVTIDQNRLKETGPIVAARAVRERDQVTIISREGMVLRTSVDNISKVGRAARGVTVMKLRKGDGVASIAPIEGERASKSAGDGRGR